MAYLYENQNDEENYTLDDKSESRIIFSENLQYLMNKSGKKQKVVASAIGISTATFSEWINAKKYPRIDKIEALANYFDVPKSLLIEKQDLNNISVDIKIQEAKRDVLDIVLRLHTDSEFFELVELVSKLDKEQLSSINQMIKVFDKKE